MSFALYNIGSYVTEGVTFSFDVTPESALLVDKRIRWEIIFRGDIPAFSSDFISMSGDLDFVSGATASQTITLSIADDNSYEIDREFVIRVWDTNNTADDISDDTRIGEDAVVILQDDDTNNFTNSVNAFTGLGDNTFTAASSIFLNFVSANGDDSFIITRFQYGDVRINDTAGSSYIKFDRGVTIEAINEEVVSFGGREVTSVDLILSTGSTITIEAPTKPEFQYQLGDSRVLDYGDFISTLGTVSASLPYVVTGSSTVATPDDGFRNVIGLYRTVGDDIMGLGSDFDLNVTGGLGDDSFIITRFQTGDVRIKDVAGSSYIKFDRGVTIVSVYEEVVSFGGREVTSVDLILSTGSTINIDAPTKPEFQYQFGDGVLLNYEDFVSALSSVVVSVAGDVSSDRYVVGGVIFGAGPYHYSVSENLDASGVGNAMVLGSISATGTSGETLNYAFDGGTLTDSLGHFAITSVGEISYIGSGLDRETTSVHYLKVQATSSDGSVDVSNISIEVDNVNEVPVLLSMIGRQTVTTGVDLDISSFFGGGDVVISGDELTYTAMRVDSNGVNPTALPSGLSINADTGFSASTSAVSGVTYRVEVTATDSGGLSVVSNVFDLYVNTAPDVSNSIDNATVTLGDSHVITIADSNDTTSNVFSDVDTGDSLSYSVTLSDGSSLPSGITFGEANGVTQLVFDSLVAVGVYDLIITATDTHNVSVTESFSVTVNTPPRFSSPDAITFTNNDSTVTEDDSTDNRVSGALSFSDVDDTLATLSLHATNDGTAPTASIGLLTFTSGEASIGGTYGTFTFMRDTTTSAVTWTYELDNTDSDTNALGSGVSVTESVQLLVRDDGNAVSSVETLSVTIEGSNDDPAFSSTSAITFTNNDSTITEDDSTDDRVSGALSFSDVDTGDTLATLSLHATNDGTAPTASIGLLTFTSGEASIDGVYGIFTFTRDATTSAVTWTYVLNNSNSMTDALDVGVSVTDSVQLLVRDDDNAVSSVETLTVNIEGSNDDPAFSSNGITFTNNDSTITENDSTDNRVSGALSFSDVDTGDTLVDLLLHATNDGTPPTASIGLLTFTSGEVSIDGVYGRFTFMRDATTSAVTWTYLLDSTDSDTNALGSGVSVTDSVQLLVRDDDNAVSSVVTLSVTVEGSNDAPVFLSNAITNNNDTVTEDDSTDNRVSGALSFSDVDTGDTLATLSLHATNDGTAPTASIGELTFTSDEASIGGTYGTFTFMRDATTSTVTWTYELDDTDSDTNALDSGVSVTESVQLLVRDDDNAVSSVETLSVTVEGSNDAPAFSSTSAITFTNTDSTVTEDDSTDNRVSGALAFSDVDSGDTLANFSLHATNDGTPPTASIGLLTFTSGEVSIDGVYGRFTFMRDATTSAVTWTYLLDSTDSDTNTLGSGAMETESIQLLVRDDDNAVSSVETLTVTVEGSNDAPVFLSNGITFTNTDSTATEDDSTDDRVSGALSFSDVDDTLANLSLHATNDGTAPTVSIGLLTFTSGEASIDGVYGAFTFMRDATTSAVTWTYELDDTDSDSDTNALGSGAMETESVQLLVRDDDNAVSSVETLTVNIEGSNDAPVFLSNGITFTNNNDTVTEDDSTDNRVYGALSFSDVDDTLANLSLHATNDGTAPTVSIGLLTFTSGEVSIDGVYGAFTFTRDATTSAVTWMYELDDTDSDTNALGSGAMETESVQLLVRDDDNAVSSVVTLSVTVVGSNDAPAFSSPDAITFTNNDFTVTEDDSTNNRVSGALSFSDVDDTLANLSLHATNDGTAPTASIGLLTFTSDEASIDGVYGAFTFTRDATTSAVTWTYLLDSTDSDTNALDSGAMETESVQLLVRDDDNAVSTPVETLSVTVEGSNDAPVFLSNGITFTNTDSTVTEDDSTNNRVSGALSFSDDDSDDTLASLSLHATNDGTDPTASIGGLTFTSGEVSIDGVYGRFTFMRDATTSAVTWTYELDDTDSDTNALGSGAMETESVQLLVRDDDNAVSTPVVTLSVTVEGSNDDPTISLTASTIAIDEGTLTEDSDTGRVFTFSDPEGEPYTFTVDDSRFELRVSDNHLIAKDGTVFDYETEPRINVVITATNDGDSNEVYTRSTTISIANVYEAPVFSTGTSSGTIAFVTNLAPSATVTTDITNWSFGTAEENIANINDGDLTAVKYGSAVAPFGVAGKHISFDLGKDYVEGKFIYHNRNDGYGYARDRVNGSTVAFIKDGVSVYSEVIANADNTITITAPVDTLFDTARITFSGYYQNFREIEVFGSPVGWFNIDENIGIADVVYTASATPDALATSAVVYTLGGTDAAFFNIGGSSGFVTFIASPDYESGKTDYVFDVIATTTDSNNTSLFATRQVELFILDVNYPPVVDEIWDEWLIRKDTATPFTYTIPKNAFRDPEGNTLTYSYSFDDRNQPISGGGITFNPLTNTFTLSTNPSVTGYYDVNVTVIYSQSASVDFVLPLHIIDDAALQLTSDLNTTIVKGMKTAGDIIYIPTYDADTYSNSFEGIEAAKRLTYTLGGTDASLFEINSISGVVTLKDDTNFDDELKSHYAIEITATLVRYSWWYGLSWFDTDYVSSWRIGLDVVEPVEGINHPPVIDEGWDEWLIRQDTATSFTYTIPENAFTDLDGDTLTYRFNTINDQPFSGASVSFNTVSLNTFSIENSPSVTGYYDINVRAIDSGGAFTDFVIPLHIIDYAALQLTSDLNTTIAEGMKTAGDTIYTPTYDENTYSNTFSGIEAAKSLTYSLDAAYGDGSLFNIDSSTGVVTLKNNINFDYEIKSHYAIAMTATLVRNTWVGWWNYVDKAYASSWRIRIDVEEPEVLREDITNRGSEHFGQAVTGDVSDFLGSNQTQYITFGNYGIDYFKNGKFVLYNSTDSVSKEYIVGTQIFFKLHMQQVYSETINSSDNIIKIRLPSNVVFDEVIIQYQNDTQYHYGYEIFGIEVADITPVGYGQAVTGVLDGLVQDITFANYGIDYYKNGVFVLYNSRSDSTRYEIVGSVVSFKNNLGIVYSYTITRSDVNDAILGILSIAPPADTKFDEVTLYYNGTTQHHYGYDIFGDRVDTIIEITPAGYGQAVTGVLDGLVQDITFDNDGIDSYKNGSFTLYNSTDDATKNDIKGSRIVFKKNFSTVYTQVIDSHDDIVTIIVPSNIEFNEVVIEYSGLTQNHRGFVISGTKIEDVATTIPATYFSENITLSGYGQAVTGVLGGLVQYIYFGNHATDNYKNGSFVLYNSTEEVTKNYIVDSRIIFKKNLEEIYVYTISSSDVDNAPNGVLLVRPPSDIEFDEIVIVYSGLTQNHRGYDIFGTKIETISVREDIEAGSVIYIYDAHTNGHSYTLEGSDVSDFTVSDRGIISFDNSPDYETQNSHDISLIIEDTLGYRSEVEINVDVELVEGINHAPVIDGGWDEWLIRKDTATYFTYTIPDDAFRDPDGDALTYLFDYLDQPIDSADNYVASNLYGENSFTISNPTVTGYYEMSVTVEDSQGAFVDFEITLHII